MQSSFEQSIVRDLVLRQQSLKARAVIFDLDETLIDALQGSRKAEEACAEILHDYVSTRMGPVEKADVRDAIRSVAEEMHGLLRYNRDEWWPRIMRILGVEMVLPESLIKLLTEIYWDRYAENSPLYPDALPTLDYLRKKGYRLALVSDSDGTPGRKHERIRQLPFDGVFQTVVVAGEDVSGLKPKPDAFELAAEKLRVPPDQCVYVGDRPFNDIAGAKAARMRTILVKRSSAKLKEKPDFIVESLAGLRELL